MQAYSYIRFSTPKQQQGGSLRRQTEMARAYCRGQGWTLNNSTYQDLGVSARKGKNALNGNLKEFLRAIEKGTVLPGSALIVESLDRISRQGVDEGFELVRSILKRDVDVVTLSPERHFTKESLRRLETRIEIELILARAAEESERKEVRASEVCKAKRKRAAETGEALSGRVPGWIEIKNGKPCLKEERAAVLRQILKWAAAGYGFTSIVRRLKAENVPPFNEKPWNRQYIAMLLRDERIIGKLQPLRKSKTDRPECLPNYYPPAVTEAEWYAARAGITQRKRGAKPKGGRLGEFINLFSGLLWDARTEEPMYMAHRPGRNPAVERLLMSKSAAEGRGDCISFPLWTLEQALLLELSEIDPGELSEEKDRPDEEAILSGQIADREGRLALMQKQLLGGNKEAIPEVMQVMGQLGEELKELKGRLEEAKQRAAHPLSEAWREAKGLLKALETAQDQKDVRMRLRAILGRTIASICMLVVPHGRDRYCTVQIIFKGKATIRKTVPPNWAKSDPKTGDVTDLETGEVSTGAAGKYLKKASVRTYYIHHRPPKSNGKGTQPGGWRVSSYAESEEELSTMDYLAPDPEALPGDSAGLYDPVEHFRMRDGFPHAPEWLPLPS